MTSRIERHEITLRKVVYELPGMNQIFVRRDVRYCEASDSTTDLYYPPEVESGGSLPAVVIVAGYPDAGVLKTLGCKFKEMEMNISWGKLIAASGLVAVVYTNRDPVTDLRVLLRFVREHATTLQIDSSSIGLFAASGNAPTALSVLAEDDSDGVGCTVLCCGFTLDLDGSTDVADAASKWRFVNACAGKSISDLRCDVPLFVARAGQINSATQTSTGSSRPRSLATCR
jgi:hypothetical protein